MIVERALCKIFDGMTIDVDGSPITVLNNMGNQDALDKFIRQSDISGAVKYPLIFVGLGDHYKEFSGYKYSRSKIYLLMNTKEELLYKKRADLTYAKYIEPMYQKVKRTVIENDNIIPIGEKGEKFRYEDRPNYGIVKGEVGSKVQTESVATEYVDARIIDINFKILTSCIL